MVGKPKKQQVPDGMQVRSLKNLFGGGGADVVTMRSDKRKAAALVTEADHGTHPAAATQQQILFSPNLRSLWPSNFYCPSRRRPGFDRRIEFFVGFIGQLSRCFITLIETLTKGS